MISGYYLFELKNEMTASSGFLRLANLNLNNEKGEIDESVFCLLSVSGKRYDK